MRKAEKKAEPIMTAAINDSDGQPKLSVSTGYNTKMRAYIGSRVISLTLHEPNEVQGLAAYFAKAADRMRRERKKCR